MPSKSIINKIVSPNLGYPCFVSKKKPKFKVIVEVKKKFVRKRIGKKRLHRELELLKEVFTLAPIGKSERLKTDIINVIRLKPKAVRDYKLQNYFTYIYDYYELTLQLERLQKEIPRFFLYNILCGSLENYHAVCIHNHNWKDMQFIQITDTHIATRWDSVEKDFKSFDSIDTSTETFFRKPEFYNSYDSSRDAFQNNFINPNKNLKEFIKQANKLVEEKRLDCIILTGDIVDFAFEDILDIKKSKDMCKNWELFINILLGKEKDSEELKAPIITILGNHDYRIAPFRLLWFGLHKFGISRQLQNNYFHKTGEVKRIKYALEEIPSFFVPLIHNPSLRFYANNINPFFNFIMNFGKTNFVLMDTGHEHFSYFRNYLNLRLINMFYSLFYIRDASLVNGFERRQIKFLKSSLKEFNKGDNLMLFFHAPLFNTAYKYTESNPKQEHELIMKIPRINERDPTTIAEQKSMRFETLLRKKGLNIESVFKNQLPIIDLCLKVAFNALVFSGHRHLNMDYCLERKTRTIKIKSYTKELENYPFKRRNNPFFLITTALGQIDFLDVFRSLPSYRHVTLENNKVSSVKTVMLETRPYDMIQPNVVFVRQKSKDKKKPFLLKIKLGKSKKLEQELGNKKLYHTITMRFTSGYLFSFYDIGLPIELVNNGGVFKSAETKIFFEKESPYNRPIASKILNFLFEGTDTIKFNVGKIKKGLNIHAPGIELYFESFVKEKNGKLTSLGIIHYPLRIKL